METGSAVRGEGCSRCTDVSAGDAAFFCTACGRQMKPVREGQFAFRAAEGSAEKAWKSFGFADAHASSKRARVVAIGKDSAKRAATRALAATKSRIEQAAAPATVDQGRAMGVESVVEGVEWNLSTEQLQILALARSGALRGRRRIPRKSYPQASSAKVIAASARRVSQGKSVRTNENGHATSVEQTGTPKNPEGQGSPIRGVLVRRDSNNFPGRPQSAERLASPNGSKTSQRRGSGLAVASTERQRRQMEETQEQLVALARGGVRYAGKVFHRKGVKLTEDSPRSMLPRNAFRAAGQHLLGAKKLSIGRNEDRQIFVAEMSAILRAPPVDEEAPTSGRGDVPSLTNQRSPIIAQTGTHPVEPSFVCDGVRLEIRQFRRSCRSLHKDAAPDRSETTTSSENEDKLPGDTSHVSATVAKALPVPAGQTPPGGNSDTAFGNQQPNRGPVEEAEDTANVCELLPQVAPTLPARSGGAGVNNDDSAASAGATCHRRPAPVVFCQELSHLELDVLLRPKLRWKDPLEEDRKTVGGLEATLWAASLDSLCGRLRGVFPRIHGCEDEDAAGGKRTPGSENASAAGVARFLKKSVDSMGESTGKNENPQQQQQQQQQQRVEDELPARTTTERNGSPVVPFGVSDAEDKAPRRSPRRVEGKAHPAGFSAGTRHDERRFQATKALPMVRRRKAGGCFETEAVWFDRTIVRVGARVPWGRLHRGRFAKVLFTVSLGANGRGLDFFASSNSPTADPMLRGYWDFRATDRDLARYLSSGYAAFRGASRRGRTHAYDPQRCAAELQERGELEWACAVLARKAFRLVLVVPGGVTMSLAGVPVAGGVEVPWPQDIEEDKALFKASSDMQRAWRGFASRKHTRWLRMEREGRRRLSRMRKEAEEERERIRVLEEQRDKERLALEEERRTTAQVVLASSARGRAARREASRRRAERAAQQRKLDEEAAAERKESTKVAAAAAAAQALPKPGDEEKDAVNQTAESETILTTATPGVTHLERVVTIDGTEVHLTANVREVAGGGGAEDGDKPVEMLLVAVDKKARRSSRLSLDAAEISDIVGAHRGTGNVAEGPRGVLSAVLQKLTVFNSRRKDLFILSYKGKKVVAPH